MKGRGIVVVLLVLIFLALVANLAVSAILGRSPITEDMVKAIAFWALVVADFALSGAGIYFTTRSYQKFEKSSVEWGRRGFLAHAVVTAVFALAPWMFFKVPEEITRADAMFNMSLVLLLFGLANGTFLFSFYRDYIRTTGSRSGAARSRR